MNKTSKKALLIMAHGSRAQAANEEFLALVDSLTSKTRGYDCIRGIFLELAEPSLEDAVAEIRRDTNITEFDLYPLFFNAGKHVQRDIPAQISAAKTNFSGIEINQLRYFGASDQLAGMVADDLLLQTATE